MSSQPLSILVLGAGELGLTMLRQLARRIDPASGVTLSVLLRPATLHSEAADKRELLRTLRDLDVRIVSGDLANDSDAGLAALLGGFHTVIGCTGFVGGSGTQLRITRAVLAAGVPRYVPWQFGVDYDVIGRGSAQDLWDEQLDVRDLLRAQRRTRWVIVSTGMFTSFLFEPSFGIVDLAQNTVHALGSWENAVTVTTPADIGRLTGEILFTEPPIIDQVVYTAGDTLTYAGLADTVDAVLARKVRRVAWSVPRLQTELAQDPDNSLKKYRLAFAQGRGVAWSPDGTFNFRRGIKTTDVAEWITQNLWP